MIRRFAVALAAASIALSLFVSGAVAYSEGTTCVAPPAGYFKVCFAEDANGGGDQFINIGTQVGYAPLGVSSLYINHSLPGMCNATVKIGDNWNDCLSSMRIWAPAYAHVCVYNDTGYANRTQDWYAGSTAKSNVSVNLTSNDSASSLYFTVNGGCP